MSQPTPYPGASPQRQPVIFPHELYTVDVAFGPERQLAVATFWNTGGAALRGSLDTVQADCTAQLQRSLGERALITTRDVPSIGNTKLTVAQTEVSDYNHYLTLSQEWIKQPVNDMGNNMAVTDWEVPDDEPSAAEIDLRDGALDSGPEVVIDTPTAQEILRSYCTPAIEAFRGIAYQRDELNIAEVRSSPGYPWNV
ncbi:MAG TPA: hypothetical protein VK674_01310 [Candidatus Limnocylindria bacterium]|nr:hypothetical protein [Candidatus Limnocylindria bacterium]